MHRRGPDHLPIRGNVCRRVLLQSIVPDSEDDPERGCIHDVAASEPREDCARVSPKTATGHFYRERWHPPGAGRRAPGAQERVHRLVEEFAWLDEGSTVIVRDTSGSSRWWTFAGFRANAALRATLGPLAEGQRLYPKPLAAALGQPHPQSDRHLQ